MSTSVGRYRLGPRLGEGGMGVVYQAEDEVLRRSVALKFLAPELAADAEYRARFLREARVAGALHHPNTCVVYEVGETSGSVEGADGRCVAAFATPFIAMELVDGETLSSRLARTGALDPPAALDIARQVAEGLAEAHRRQIVHRDLKPQNVMITPEGRVKIVDFGLAKPLVSASRQGGIASTSRMISADVAQDAVFGTCAYMSPEQAAGKPTDTRSDVFSFGVLLYEMLTARLPFDGQTPAEVIAKIIEGEPVPLPPQTPRRLRRVVRRCLEKGPSARYPDGGELLRALRQDRRPLPPLRWRQSSSGTRRTLVAGTAVGVLGGVSYFLRADVPLPNTPVAGQVAPAAPDAPSSDPGDGPGTPDTTSGGRLSRAASPEAAPGSRSVHDSVPAPPPSRRPTAVEAAPDPGIAPDRGRVSIASDPRASVTIDGELVGVTPVTVTIPGGGHELVLTAPGGLRWRGRIDVRAADEVSIHRDLTQTGSLSVVSDTWAEVRLDDGAPEQTPIHYPRVPAGLHSLTVTRGGTVTQVLEVSIENGKTTSVRIRPDEIQP